MKKYIFDIHYDMVIRGIEVMADSIGEAAQLAKDKAARLPMESAECVEQDACLDEVTDISPRELRRMQAPCIIDYVHMTIDALTSYTDNREESCQNCQELAGIAYGKAGINWLGGQDVSNEQWQEQLFDDVSEFRGINANGLCDRYARMYARQKFDRRYKNTAKSPFEARVEGLSKEQKKQAVTEAVGVLCNRMECYIEHEDDEDYKVWEPQMIVRYDFGRDEHGHDDYWNLFVYCHGPNDQDGRDCYELATAWQHVHHKEDGRDDTDDYGTEFHKSRAELLRTLFYKDAPQFEETDECPEWHDIESVWVD